MDENEEIDVEKALYSKFGDVDIEKTLMVTVQDIKNGSIKFLTHKQVFKNAKRIVNKTEK